MKTDKKTQKLSIADYLSDAEVWTRVEQIQREKGRTDSLLDLSRALAARVKKDNQ